MRDFLSLMFICLFLNLKANDPLCKLSRLVKGKDKLLDKILEIKGVNCRVNVDNYGI